MKDKFTFFIVFHFLLPFTNWWKEMREERPRFLRFVFLTFAFLAGASFLAALRICSWPLALYIAAWLSIYCAVVEVLSSEKCQSVFCLLLLTTVSAVLILFCSLLPATIYNATGQEIFRQAGQITGMALLVFSFYGWFAGRSLKKSFNEKLKKMLADNWLVLIGAALVGLIYFGLVCLAFFYALDPVWQLKMHFIRQTGLALTILPLALAILFFFLAVVSCGGSMLPEMPEVSKEPLDEAARKKLKDQMLNNFYMNQYNYPYTGLFF